MAGKWERSKFESHSMFGLVNILVLSRSSQTFSHFAFSSYISTVKRGVPYKAVFQKSTSIPKVHKMSCEPLWRPEQLL